MSGQSIEPQREQVINYLTECFANDILTTEEYEYRVGRAAEANVSGELEAIIADIRRPQHGPGSRTGNPAVRPSRDITEGRDRQRVLSILGEQQLSGNWMKKDSVLVQAFMGSVSCDLRDVRLFPVNRIQIYSLMAEVKITVPQGIALVSNVSPILGEIKRRDRSPDAMPGAPVIEIGGLIIMSELKILG
jgi:hypothetical protein